MNEQSSDPNQQQPQDAGAAAERIASEAEDVQERIRRLVVETAGPDGLRTSRLRETANEILDGVGKGVEQVSTERRGEVLGETLDGLSEGYQRVAQATKLAIEEAEARGEQFAKEDLERVRSDLSAVNEMLTQSFTDLAKSVESNTREAAGDLVDHARRTAESVRPSIEKAIDAAREHPAKFATESAAAGVDAARQGVGALFDAASGLLQGAGDIISGKKRDEKKR